MEYKNFGRTGVKVSRICLGCMMFGWRSSETDSIKIIDKAIDDGINFLDTANVYGRGSSEEIVGKSLKQNGKRDKIFLTTKVHHKMDDNDVNAFGNSRRHIISECEASLKRLQTDYIDLYQIHRPQSDIPIDETLRALDDLVKAGKVLYIGTSTFASWQIMESLWVAKELGLNRLVSEQPPYHLLDRRAERELFPMAENYGLAILPWSPLAGGFLTGKYKRNEERPEDSRLTERNEWKDHHFSDAAFDVLDVVIDIAKEKNVTPSQLSLAWTFRNDIVTSTIIGPRTMEQYEDNIKALDIKLTDEDNKRLDKVSLPGRTILSYYEADYNSYKYRW
jgi:aryl-alcohol dehydrogenase-like predicted oxidoreductase